MVNTKPVSIAKRIPTDSLFTPFRRKSSRLSTIPKDVPKIGPIYGAIIIEAIIITRLSVNSPSAAITDAKIL